MPGPACYGRGGELPTLTDANLVLGLIAPESFLGGRLDLNRDLAANSMARHIARPLGLSVEDAALAVNALASARIAEGIRANTVRRGLDPREFTIFSFGGAGGLHAAAVALELEFPRAIVPREASVLSALGFLAADVRHDFQRAYGRRMVALKSSDISAVFAELEAEARDVLRDAGFEPAQTRFARFADCRYMRQVYTVPIPLSDLDRRDDIGWLVADYEAAYSDLYQHLHERDAIVVDTCRLVAYGVLPSLSLPRGENTGADPAAVMRGARHVYFGDWVETPSYWFDGLTPGMRLEGPALIDSESTTVVLPPDSAADVDPYGSLIVTNKGGRA